MILPPPSRETKVTGVLAITEGGAVNHPLFVRRRFAVHRQPGDMTARLVARISGPPALARRVLRLSLAVALASVSGLASPALVAALPYDGTNPAATPCGDGSHPPVTLDTAVIYDGGAPIGRVELRQSVYCATVWTRVWNDTSSALNLRETIILYDSPNLTGGTAYPITDNAIPAHGSAWSKQYRDRAAFRAKGEILHNGAWRYAQTDASLMWTQREGTYDQNPSSQPYTCGDSTHPCVRWRVNADGSPITLHYVDDASLLTLPGDPVGDIDFILGRYTALTGPAPNLQRVPSSQLEEVLEYAYSAIDGAYARSWSYEDGDHYF